MRRPPSRRLIENYPNAKDLVAEARKHLPSGLELLPTPWALGERMQLNMKLPTGLDIGTMIYMVDGAKHDGKDVTRCSTRGLVTVNGAASYSEVLCETDSFQPIESFWKHSLLGEASAKYSDSSVIVERRRQRQSVHDRLHAAGVRQRTMRRTVSPTCRSRKATRRRSPSSRRSAATRSRLPVEVP